MIYTYTDKQLTEIVTDPLEARAIEYIESLGTFPETPIDWKGRLVVLRVYLILCQEHAAAQDDLYSVKLKNYRNEFDAVLSSARDAAQEAGEEFNPLFSIPIERS